MSLNVRIEVFSLYLQRNSYPDILASLQANNYIYNTHSLIRNSPSSWERGCLAHEYDAQPTPLAVNCFRLRLFKCVVAEPTEKLQISIKNAQTLCKAN
jgi:hypothetical protein